MRRVTRNVAMLFCWVAIGVLPSVGQSLLLRESVTVDGQGVSLGDLVVASQELPPDWSKRFVAEAPMPGESKLLRLGDIARALHQYSDMHQVVLHGQAEIRVRVKVTEFDVGQVEAAIAAFTANDVDLAERRFRISPRSAVLPSVPADAGWEPEVLGVDETATGVSARVRFVSSTGTLPERGFVTLDLVELFPYWQARGPLLRGTVLEADDLAERWVSRAEGGRYYSTTDTIAGMELRRNLQGGQMVVIGSLAEPIYAKRGEIVRVFMDRGGLRVTLRARVLADARRDERVPCLNERSGRRLYVRMVSPREAILEEGEGAES